MSAFARLFDAKRHALEHPTPPDFHGTRHNQFTRQTMLESWHRHQAKMKHYRPLSPEARDAHVFGSWRAVVIAERGELANVVRIRKAQTAMRHAKARRTE